MFKDNCFPVIGYIFCCFLLTFVSGITHPAAVPFLTIAVGYGAIAAIPKMKVKQKLVCLAFSAAAAAALLPGSGLYRLLLQNKSEQVQSWAFPQYFLLLVGLLLGLWGLELLAQRLSENAALVGALVLLLAGIGSFEPLFAMAWAGRFDLVGSIWSTVWLPLVIGLFAGGFGSLGKQAAKTHKKYFLALQAVLLAVILVSMARGLHADFFWTKNKLDFLCAYPFASGAFLGCSALSEPDKNEK